MRVAMTSFQKNPHIDRSIDFIAKFASETTTIANKKETTIEEDEEFKNEFLKSLIDWLIEVSINLV